ncbi:response regulator [Variovorax robiniae]
MNGDSGICGHASALSCGTGSVPIEAVRMEALTGSLDRGGPSMYVQSGLSAHRTLTLTREMILRGGRRATVSLLRCMKSPSAHRPDEGRHLIIPIREEHSQPHKAARNLRVLVVEDDADALHLTQELLVLMGHWSAGVSSAEAAVARFSEGAFDVLLLDVNLPALSGLDLAEKLGRRERLPVIFASGVGRPRHGEDGDIWLNKPYTTEQLEEALSRAEEVRGTLPDAMPVPVLNL